MMMKVLSEKNSLPLSVTSVMIGTTRCSIIIGISTLKCGGYHMSHDFPKTERHATANGNANANAATSDHTYIHLQAHQRRRLYPTEPPPSPVDAPIIIVVTNAQEPT